MRTLSINEIIKATNGALLRNSAQSQDLPVVTAVSTDSRTAGSGAVFFAFKGEKFDAHDFLRDVDRQGCRALVVGNANAVPEDFTGVAILVSDTIRAYQDLAAYYRDLIDPVVVAITGSVGKTSLKDMIAAAIGSAYRMVASDKNYNNHIGVPKTIFEADDSTEVLILEMGMSAAGEIHRLAEIGKPDVAVITGVGISHRENFDSDDGVFHAKMEITDFFEEDNVLVVNGDDPRLRPLAEGHKGAWRIVTAGRSEGSDFRVTQPKYVGKSKIAFEIAHAYEVERFELPVAGLYNGITAGLASAALAELDVGLSRVSAALRKIARTEHRLELIEVGGITIIDDTYNASPDSMKSGLEFLMSPEGVGVADRIREGEIVRRIAVLADMKELGPDSDALHRNVGSAAAEAGVDLLLTIGEGARAIAAGAEEYVAAHNVLGASGTRVIRFDKNDEAIPWLLAHRRDGDVYLVKGSHSMHMDAVAAALAEDV